MNNLILYHMEYQTDKPILAIGRILLMLHKTLNSHKTELELYGVGPNRELLAGLALNTKHILNNIEDICEDEELFTERQLLCIKAMAELLHRDQEAREKAIAAYEQSLL
jgi:hypothetical protein